MKADLEVRRSVSVPTPEPPAASPAPPSVGPATPTRRTRTGQFLFGAFLNGLGLLVLVYVSGLLFLLGDPRVELYVLMGAISGAILLPLLGALLVRHIRHALFWSTLLAIAGSVAVTVVNSLDPVTTYPDLLLRSFLCTFVSVPLTVVALPRIVGESRSRRAYLWAVALSVGPIVMGISYSVIYAEENFEGFAYLVVATEAVAAVILVALALHASRLGRQKRAHRASRQLRDRADSPSIDAVRTGLVLALVVLMALPAQALVSGSTTAPASAVSEASVVLTPPLARTPIQHVVMLMMENHAFDNLFGVYPQTPDGADAPGVTVPDGLANAPFAYRCGLQDPVPAGCGPGSVTLLPNGTFSTPDPIEGYSPYHIDWDQGKMDGWLDDGGSGPASLTTYGANQAAIEWVLAQEYALADQYRSSMLTETTPNRLYSIAGFTPVTDDYGPPPYIPYDETVFGELTSHDLTWGYYFDDPNAETGIMSFVSGMGSYGSSIQSWADFASQAQTGTLPNLAWVSVIDGGLGEDQYSEEPPGSLLSGEMWLLYMINLVMSGPDWNSTAIVLTYDEAGGYYDQSAPPTLDGELLGERLPMILISPYAKEDYVSSTEMNHDSWLAFVDYNWGLPALTTFVSDSNLPLDLFDFAQTPRAPLALTAARGFPAPTSLPFSLPSSPDLARLFPQPFQEPLASLPYDLTGNSSVTLASLGVPVEWTSDTTLTPVYASLPFLAAVFVLELIVWEMLPSLPRFLDRPRP